MGQFSMEISGHAGAVLSGNQQMVCFCKLLGSDTIRMKQRLAVNSNDIKTHMIANLFCVHYFLQACFFGKVKGAQYVQPYPDRNRWFRSCESLC